MISTTIISAKKSNLFCVQKTLYFHVTFSFRASQLLKLCFQSMFAIHASKLIYSMIYIQKNIASFLSRLNNLVEKWKDWVSKSEEKFLLPSQSSLFYLDKDKVKIFIINSWCFNVTIWISFLTMFGPQVSNLF